LHEIRKRAKRARYAAELAAAGIEVDAGRLAKRLADMQDVLGELQDAVATTEGLGPRMDFLEHEALHCRYLVAIEGTAEGSGEP
jgi:CHAD domain-containing protein